MKSSFTKQPTLYDIKISKENGKIKLEKIYYKLKVIKENYINKVIKKYIDADLINVKVK